MVGCDSVEHASLIAMFDQSYLSKNKVRLVNLLRMTASEAESRTFSTKADPCKAAYKALVVRTTGQCDGVE